MVKAFSKNPSKLLEHLRDKIRDGEILTWQENDKGYLTHIPGQWKNKAWFKPKIGEDGLIFNIVRPKGKNISKEVYAVYHGRLSEMLLAHFDDELSAVRASSLAGLGDLV